MTPGARFACVYPPAIAVTAPSCSPSMPCMSDRACSSLKNNASRDPELLKTYLTPDATICSTIKRDALAVISLVCMMSLLDA